MSNAPVDYSEFSGQGSTDAAPEGEHPSAGNEPPALAAEADHALEEAVSQAPANHVFELAEALYQLDEQRKTTRRKRADGTPDEATSEAEPEGDVETTDAAEEEPEPEKEKKDTVRASLVKALAGIAGFRTEFVDVRTYSRTGNGEARSGETLGRRFRHEKAAAVQAAPEWVLVGLVTADAQKKYTQAEVHERLLDAIEPWIEGVCTTAIFLSRQTTGWTLGRLYQTVGHEEPAEKIAAALGLPTDRIRDLPTVKPLVPLPSSQQGKKVPQPPSPFDEQTALADLFMSREEFAAVVKTWRLKKNLILTGPPGVGKTHLAKTLAYSLLGAKDADRLESIQFHQSYSYEDFIRGWRPTEKGNFALVDGVFYTFSKQAELGHPREHVFIVDEINRGNLSKIFGEAMVLIEADKRGANNEVPLMYRRNEDERFSIPENVYLLGMMNTADRSLALVDYALRRRFAFHRMVPNFGPKFQAFVANHVADVGFVAFIVEKATALNKIILKTRGLGPGFLVGHSFFLPPRGTSGLGGEWLRDVVTYDLQPLLEEYWFDNQDKAKELVKDFLAGVERFDAIHSLGQESPKATEDAHETSALAMPSSEAASPGSAAPEVPAEESH